VELSEEGLITEQQVAQRLGVSSRQVRKYLKNWCLPHIGEGRARHFEWLVVLEWYLVYRVNISGTGGSQKDVLAQKLAEIRNEAGRKARVEFADSYRGLRERDTARLRLQIEQLQRKRRR
jgi:hypothetical protein